MACGQEGEERVHDNGHTIIFSEQLTNFKHMLPIIFKREFTFDCNVSPTKWLIEVTFQRGSNGISCVLDIKRKDEVEIEVAMIYMMKAFPVTFDINIPLKSVRVPTVRGMSVFVHTVDDFLTDEILDQISAPHLDFEVLFSIHGCHGQTT